MQQDRAGLHSPLLLLGLLLLVLMLVLVLVLLCHGRRGLCLSFLLLQVLHVGVQMGIHLQQALEHEKDLHCSVMSGLYYPFMHAVLLTGAQA